MLPCNRLKIVYPSKVYTFVCPSKNRLSVQNPCIRQTTQFTPELVHALVWMNPIVSQLAHPQYFGLGVTATQTDQLVEKPSPLFPVAGFKLQGTALDNMMVSDIRQALIAFKIYASSFGFPQLLVTISDFVLLFTIYHFMHMFLYI